MDLQGCPGAHDRAVTVARSSRAGFMTGGLALFLTAASSAPAVPPCCIDFAVIGRMFRRSVGGTARPSTGHAYADKRAVALRDRIWSDRSTIDVSFLDGTAAQQHRVEKFAPLWSAACAIKFAFQQGAAGVIRISFAHGLVGFSTIGNEALSIQPPQPTMNLAQMTDVMPDDKARGLVLHEFGHALGLLHEHQSPVSGITWNRAAAHDFFSAKPYYLSPSDVDSQILDAYAQSQTQFTNFDRSSIMIYPIPAFLTKNGYEVSMNSTLSLTDRSFISKIYPK